MENKENIKDFIIKELEIIQGIIKPINRGGVLWKFIYYWIINQVKNKYKIY